MTSLNSKLQLALLNRKKGRNLLEKGFTLVELMIVIVIVGILSAVALPNFLNQTNKARATECKTIGGSLLTEVATEAHSEGVTTAGVTAAAATVRTGTLADANTDSDLCTFTLNDPVANSTTATLDIAGKGALAGENYNGCIDPENGKKDMVDGAVATKPANCA